MNPTNAQKGFTRLKRYTPLRRSGYVRHASSHRQEERTRYAHQRLAYLEAHPFCQLTIARLGLEERLVVALGGISSGWIVPRATEIHHRNKGRGARLLDERWWMAVSASSHEGLEANKGWARECGYLLPIQADADGKWGAGNAALPTPELLRSKERA